MMKYRHPKILPPIKAKRTWAKNSFRQPFQDLDISQRLRVTQEVFMQEKQWNFSRNSESCGILTCPFLFPVAQSNVVTLKTNSPQSWWKPAAWQPLEGDRARLELLQSPIPRELLLSDLPSGFLEDPIYKAVFICPDSEPSFSKKAVGGEGRKYLLKMIIGNCWISCCLRRWLTVWVKHRLTKKLKKKSRAMACP